MRTKQCLLIMKWISLAILALLVGVTRAESFKGYECRKDCSGHRAGYEWAKKKGVTEPRQCTGKSQSFVEGCKAWADGKNAVSRW